MDSLSPIDRLLRTDNIFNYQGDLLSDARRARKAIDTFNRVNDIIQNPEKARPTMSQLLNESYQVNFDLLSHSLNQTSSKGLHINKLV